MTIDQIVFARTRHEYDSYMDFWRLVELSGFPTIYVDEIRLDQPGVYITSPMNGDYRAHLANEIERMKGSHNPILAHLILWNLERPSGSAGSVGNYALANRQLIYDRFVDEIWVSDRRLADEASLRFVPLGSDEGLGEPSKDKKFDFCHMSYLNNRRQTILKHFPISKIGPNCWPPQRHDILQQSKFALNIHQDHHPFQEPLRFALFAAYGLPIVSEFIYDSFPWEESMMIWAAYDGLVGKLSQMLGNDYSQWEQMGLHAREVMCEDFQFGKVVRRAVEESLNSWR